MDEASFQKRLSELIAQIDTLPEAERERLRAMAAETRQRHEDLRKSVTSMQESLDFLRLWIKYMLFDLEATRRENAYLRKMLEQDPGQGGEGRPPEG
jgi:predicted enzyme involved in methoxymalonyl-ACP biosynthesis